MTIFEELLAEMRRYRELLRVGQNSFLDDVQFDGGRPVCVPPMTRKNDCQNERTPQPMTDDEREAVIRRQWAGQQDCGPGGFSDFVFLLRRLDELRASIAPPPDPQPAHDWIGQLDRPYQTPI